MGYLFAETLCNETIYLYTTSSEICYIPLRFSLHILSVSWFARLCCLVNFFDKTLPFLFADQNMKKLQQICFAFAHQLSESDFE